MKFYSAAPSFSSAATLTPARPNHRSARAIRWWSLGAACLLGASLSGCGKAGTTATEPTPAPTPTATPTPVVVATPTPTPEPTVEAARYTGNQQAEYIKTAQDAFIEARSAKSNAFVEANNALMQAGGFTPKGISNKDAIEQRRAMAAKCQQANSDYLAFVETQDEAYRTELAKTPLIKSDVDGIVQDFSEKSKADTVKKLRQTVGDRLKVGDDMLAYLSAKYGAWTANNGKLSFKKPADVNGYVALEKKYNALTAETQKLQNEVNTPQPSPGASTAPSPAAAPVAPGAAGSPGR